MKNKLNKIEKKKIKQIFFTIYFNERKKKWRVKILFVLNKEKEEKN